jgi:hypothetical protein
MFNAKYFEKHPAFNSLIHLIAGIGLGCLLVTPLFDGHTVRWGIALLLIGLLGHIYAWYSKK